MIKGERQGEKFVYKENSTMKDSSRTGGGMAVHSQVEKALGGTGDVG